jgi:hypothetical protein
MQTNMVVTIQDKNQLIKYIQAEVLRQMKERLVVNSDNVLKVLEVEFEKIRTSPEAVALISGILRYDLGIYSREAETVLDQIIEIIRRDAAYSFAMPLITTPSSIQINITLLKSDYAEMLAIPEAHYEQNFYVKDAPGRPFTIPWLDWLLMRGYDIVVQSYHVSYNINKNTVSRTGGAIMNKNGQFIIPREFAGTATDNFITRSLVNLDQILFKEFESILS